MNPKYKSGQQILRVWEMDWAQFWKTNIFSFKLYLSSVITCHKSNQKVSLSL